MVDIDLRKSEILRASDDTAVAVCHRVIPSATKDLSERRLFRESGYFDWSFESE